MYDNIGFIINTDNTPELKDIKEYRGNLMGYYKNLRVTHYPDFIYCSGSIAKFLNGENVTPLNRKTYIKALETLEKETGWDLNNSEIKTLEVGYTIPVSEPVNSYLELFDYRSRFTKMVYSNQTIETVLYKTTARSFSCYDKGIESKNNIPQLYKGGNLLRLELKYKRGFTKNIGKYSLWELANKEIYSKLVNNWKDFYQSIQKKNNIVLNTSQNPTPSIIENALTAIGINTYGYDNLIHLINSLEKSGKLGSKQCQRAKSKAKTLHDNKRISKTNNLIYELDSRVIEIATRL